MIRKIEEEAKVAILEQRIKVCVPQSSGGVSTARAYQKSLLPVNALLL